MPKFYSLFSSSKGNCAYLENESGGILIDASPSFKSIENAFSLREISLENLKGVIITHEHSDHISGLKELFMNDDIKVSNLIMPDTALVDSDYENLVSLAESTGSNAGKIYEGMNLRRQDM